MKTDERFLAESLILEKYFKDLEMFFDEYDQTLINNLCYLDNDDKDSNSSDNDHEEEESGKDSQNNEQEEKVQIL